MLTLKESFNNVKVICNNALMKREEWLAIDESLSNIAGALQAHEAALQAAEEITKDKSQPEEKSDESEN